MPCGKFPWIKLASAGAGLGHLSVAFEQSFEHPGGRRSLAQRAPPGSAPSALGAVALAGAAQWRWALPNPRSNS